MTTDTAVRPEQKLRLHELTDAALDLERLMDQLAESDKTEEERDEALREALALIDQDISQTGAALAALVVNRRADAGVLADKAKALTDRAKAMKARADAVSNGADRIADYIAGCLAARGDDTQKLGGKTADVTVTVSKQSGAKLKIIDASLLPIEHLTAKLHWPADLVPAVMAGAVVDRFPNPGLLDDLKDVEELPAGVERVLPTRAVRFR